jgi:CPA2 family monovalent cation:H+ antiporter-2
LTIDPYTLRGAVGPALGAVLLTVIGNVGAGLLAGHSARLSWRASTTIGLTILSRGEFSIIMANLGKVGGLLPVLQPFAALYVLILSVLGPLLTKEAGRIYHTVSQVRARLQTQEKDEPPPLPESPREEQDTG